MLRVLAAVTGTLLLLVGAWVFLRGNSAREAATAPGRDTAVGMESDGRAEIEAAPIDASRKAATDAVEAEAETSSDAAPVPLTGVLAGRLLIDGAPLAETIELWLEPANEAVHAGTRGTLRTDAFGRFRREGLPLDWAGSLRLPAPYRCDVHEDSWSSSVAIERLGEDFVLEVERPHALVMRVLRPDRARAPGVDLRLRVHDTSGSSDNGARSDMEGRACVAWGETRPHLVEVFVRAPDGAAVSKSFGPEVLVPSGPYGDIDLGDLVLAEGRWVDLHFVSEADLPLIGLDVLVRGADLVQQRTTDGQGVLRIGLPREHFALEFQAAGFALARTEVPAETLRLDVRLRVATLLRVTVVDSRGRPWIGCRVRITADDWLFGPERDLPSGSRLRNARAGFRSGGTHDTHYVSFVIAGEQAVEVQGLSEGLAFELQAEDEIGQVGARLRQPGLAAQERRDVRLQLDRDPCALEGKVLDVNGQPVLGAVVIAEGESNGLVRNSAGDGSFSFPALLAPLLTLSAQGAGHQATHITDVNPCAGAVTLTLFSARRLTVSRRDALGRDVRAGQLVVWAAAGSRAFHARDADDRFDGLPFEPLVLIWHHCGRQVHFEIDDASESIEIGLPTLGEVEIAVEGWSARAGEHLYARVEALDDPALVCERQVLESHPDVRTRLSLWPGRYRLTALVHRYEADSSTSTRELGDPREVEIVPGTSVSVTLGL